MDKKYPKDTPVTLEMLAEITDKAHMSIANAQIRSMIEPPKQQPKEGEWWMCRNEIDCFEVPLLLQAGQWCGTTRGIEHSCSEQVTPLHKMVPEQVGE